MKSCPLVVKVIIGIFQVVSSDFYTFPELLLERQMVTGFISLTKRWAEEGPPTALILGHGSFLHWCPVQPRGALRGTQPYHLLM